MHNQLMLYQSSSAQYIAPSGKVHGHKYRRLPATAAAAFDANVLADSHARYLDGSIMRSQEILHGPQEMSPSGRSPLSDFKKIHKRTSLYTPKKPNPGELIIICTWLGAGPKHIAKYVAMHRGIAPAARILLIESSVPILVSSYAHQRRMITPSVGVVIDTLAESRPERGVETGSGPRAAHPPPPPPPRILLHAFSNGGCNTATQLLLALAGRTGAALPLTGVLLDSCPAKGTYWKSYDAMVLSLPRGAATRLLGAVVVHGLLVLLYAWIACGNENPAGLMRRTLLSDETVGGAGPAAPTPREEGGGDGDDEKGPEGDEGEWDHGRGPPFQRSSGRVCYIYSRADRMCQWTDVREHAEDARALGWRVREVVFEDTGHVAHYQKNEEAYTNAAWEIWEPAVDGMRRERPRARL